MAATKFGADATDAPPALVSITAWTSCGEVPTMPIPFVTAYASWMPGAGVGLETYRMVTPLSVTVAHRTGGVLWRTFRLPDDVVTTLAEEFENSSGTSRLAIRSRLFRMAASSSVPSRKAPPGTPLPASPSTTRSPVRWFSSPSGPVMPSRRS